MNAAVVVVLVIIAVVVIVAVVVLGRRASAKNIEKRRAEANEHRETARIRQLEGDRAAAEAEERGPGRDGKRRPPSSRRWRLVASAARPPTLKPEPGTSTPTNPTAPETLGSERSMPLELVKANAGDEVAAGREHEQIERSGVTPAHQDPNELHSSVTASPTWRRLPRGSAGTLDSPGSQHARDRADLCSIAAPRRLVHVIAEGGSVTLRCYLEAPEGGAPGGTVGGRRCNPPGWRPRRTDCRRIRTDR